MNSLGKVMNIITTETAPPVAVLPPLTCSPALADIAHHMEAEARQFDECSRRHQSRGNVSAADVADRASLRLTQFAFAVRQCQESTERT